MKHQNVCIAISPQLCKCCGCECKSVSYQSNVRNMKIANVRNMKIANVRNLTIANVRNMKIANVSNCKYLNVDQLAPLILYS